VGDDWSCAPENHLPESNVKLFRRIPEGYFACKVHFFRVCGMLSEAARTQYYVIACILLLFALVVLF
jgi:hypothetical protein